ncbi:hypothetical protein BKP37_14585 [Anaerobacillus alkalilacustris]|uniref:Uncharacterized protein n=1 Tax=Anaerobacillus alkalilacustris TaxID=393763 RepID=A0A1S2LHV9_9BACI|nr:hypothetical protein BKP37_14585 [Anaerobacillus alkalilacustris]
MIKYIKYKWSSIISTPIIGILIAYIITYFYRRTVDIIVLIIGVSFITEIVNYKAELQSVGVFLHPPPKLLDFLTF